MYNLLHLKLYLRNSTGSDIIYFDDIRVNPAELVGIDDRLINPRTKNYNSYSHLAGLKYCEKYNYKFFSLSMGKYCFFDRNNNVNKIDDTDVFNELKDDMSKPEMVDSLSMTKIVDIYIPIANNNTFEDNQYEIIKVWDNFSKYNATFDKKIIDKVIEVLNLNIPAMNYYNLSGDLSRLLVIDYDGK